MDLVGIFLLAVYAIAIAGVESKQKPPQKNNEAEELGKAYMKLIDYIKQPVQNKPDNNK